MALFKGNGRKSNQHTYYMLSQTEVKATMWPRPAANGLYPIKIKIVVKGGGRDYIPLKGLNIDAKYFDKKNGKVKAAHPEEKVLNETISNQTAQVIDLVRRLSYENKFLTATELKEATLTKKNQSDFFQFMEEYFKEVEVQVTPKTMVVYKRQLNTVKAYHGNDELLFTDINVSFLSGLEKYLKDHYTPYSVQNIWAVFMSWISKARQRGVIQSTSFTGYKAPTGEPEEKAYFSNDEIVALEKYADDDSNKLKYRITAAWLVFGCYTGLRVSDWYKFDYKNQVIDGEIRLRAKKNKEYVALPYYGAFARAVNRVKDYKLKSYWAILNQIESLMKALKKNGIIATDKKITPHCTRKSFAVTICGSHDISLKDCADYMGITVTVCEESYYRITKKSLHKRSLEKWKDLA